MKKTRYILFSIITILLLVVLQQWVVYNKLINSEANLRPHLQSRLNEMRIIAADFPTFIEEFRKVEAEEALILQKFIGKGSGNVEIFIQGRLKHILIKNRLDGDFTLICKTSNEFTTGYLILFSASGPEAKVHAAVDEISNLPQLINWTPSWAASSYIKKEQGQMIVAIPFIVYALKSEAYISDSEYFEYPEEDNTEPWLPPFAWWREEEDLTFTNTVQELMRIRILIGEVSSLNARGASVQKLRNIAKTAESWTESNDPFKHTQ